MGNYTIFLAVRKSQERQTSKKFYNKCFENSRSQIVFRRDIFQELTLGALYSKNSNNLERNNLFLEGLVRGTQRLFSAKYLFGEANIA